MQLSEKILFFLLMLLSVATASASDATLLLSKARDAESQGQYSTALIHLRNAAKQYPDSLEVRLELGRVFVFTGQGQQAELELKNADRLGAKPADTLVLKTKAKFYQGQFEDLADLAGVINLPQSQIAQIRAIQGFAFFEQKKLNQARQMFERAISLDPEVLEAQLAQVRLLDVTGKQREANSLVDQLNKQYPDNPEVLILAGDSYRANQQYDKALKFFKQAGRIQQSNINIWFGIVRSYIGLNDLNSAKIEIQKILVSYPEHLVANYLLAVIATQEGDYTRAKSAIDIVLKGKKREYEALKLLGIIQFNQREYTQAEKNLSKYLSRHKDDEQAIKTLASVYLKRQQGSLALQQLTPLAESQDPYVYSLMALAYEQVGNSQKSSEYIEKSLRIAPEDKSIKRQFQLAQLETGKSLDITFNDTDYENYLQGGHIPVLNLFRLKKYDEAISIIQGYLNKQPKSALLNYMLGSAYQYKGDLNQAKTSFQKSIQLSDTLLEPRINLARVLLTEGDDRGAENLYREILKINDHNDAALVALAGIYHRRGDDTEMLKWLNLSRKYNSASLASREVLEDYYSKQGNDARALEVSEEMIEIQPENTSLLKKHADNQHAIGKTDLAVLTYQKIVALKPGFAASWYGLGRMQSLNREFKAAQKSFEKVLELEPQALVPWVVLIKLDLQFNNPDEALNKARKMLKLHPDAADSYNMLGDVYIALKQPKNAIKYFQKSTEIKYSDEAYLKLLSSYNIDGQTEKGFDLLKQWVKKFPDAVALAEVLALSYHQRGDLENARKLYEKIIKKTRNNDRVLNRLALVAMEQGSPMSLEYADLAYKLNAKNPANIDTLGWVHLNNNNFSKALAILKEASQAAPADPDVRYHYAVALSKSGKNNEAVKQLYLALATEGKFRNRNDAQKLLDKLKN
jgi:putative PEP-CTERM system TPR-repeat lipoprotein